jgi:hypothetical protein
VRVGISSRKSYRLLEREVVGLETDRPDRHSSFQSASDALDLGLLFWSCLLYTFSHIFINLIIWLIMMLFRFQLAWSEC